VTVPSATAVVVGELLARKFRVPLLRLTAVFDANRPATLTRELSTSRVLFWSTLNVVEPVDPNRFSVRVPAEKAPPTTAPPTVVAPVAALLLASTRLAPRVVVVPV
jgi:hypothetical protein